MSSPLQIYSFSSPSVSSLSFTTLLGLFQTETKIFCLSWVQQYRYTFVEKNR